MTTTEALDKIKTLLGFNMPVPAAPIPVAPVPLAVPPVVPAAPVALTEYTLADGTKASIDSLAVGGKVTVNGAPAADGVFVLDDGTSVTVAGGVITAIDMKAAEAPIEAPALMAAMRAEFATAQEKLEDRFTLQEARFTAQSEAIKNLVELVETLSKQPIAKPLEKEVDWEEMDSLAKFRATKSKAN